MAIVGQGITAYPQPDDALNENSKNPVQNKVVAGNIKELKDKDTAQDERIAAMEQVTTATTIGPVALASFDASAANMPLKGLTANIEPVQDLHGYDHPWPAGGGKNLLKYPYETGTVTKNGVTFTVYNDGSIKVDTAGAAATANADLYFFSSTGSLPLSNGDYIFSSTYDGTLPSDGFYIHAKANASDASYLNISIGDEGLYTVSNGVFYTACIRVLSGRTINNVTVRPMLRLATEADATFEPYSNICPITGWTGCKVVQTGKNLLPNDGPGLNNASGAATFVKNDDGTVSASGAATTANRYYRFGQVKLLPGRYTLSGCPSGGTSDTYFIAMRTGSYGGELWKREVGDGYTFSVSVPTTIYITLYVQPDAGTVNLTFRPMIRLATEADDTFEPYQGTTYPITFPTSAGTVYGGTLDVTTGVLEVKYIKFTLTLDLEYRNNSDRANALSVYVSLPFRAKGQFDMYCNCLKVQENARDAVVPATQIASSLWTAIIAFPKTIVSSFDDVRTKITELYNSGTPIEIVYQIDQPIVYQLTLQEVTTLLGINNIWANRGDVTVTYGAYLETVKELVDKREVREEQVEGTVVNLNAEPNTRYICGEVATLDITLPVSGICDIVFTSGSTPTVLTVPSTVKWMHGFDPTALAADTIYELNITDGLGVVASWT